MWVDRGQKQRWLRNSRSLSHLVFCDGDVTALWGTMTTDNLSYRSIPVYHFSTDRLAGLRFLLRFALSHDHSRAWIGLLTLLLTRKGGARG
jgi:hypothetical protein